MTVHAPSRLHNVTVLELRLPDPSVITLIIRDGHTFVPQPDTRIAIGDELLIVTTTKTRAAAERQAPRGQPPRQARLLVRRVRRGRTDRSRIQEAGLGSIQ